jgi:hypothetical protein
MARNPSTQTPQYTSMSQVLYAPPGSGFESVHSNRMPRSPIPPPGSFVQLENLLGTLRDEILSVSISNDRQLRDERAQRQRLQNINHILLIKVQDAEMRKHEVEQKLVKLQDDHLQLMDAYNSMLDTESVCTSLSYPFMFSLLQRSGQEIQTPLSDYKSPSFSPSLPSVKELLNPTVHSPVIPSKRASNGEGNTTLKRGRLLADTRPPAPQS